MFVKQQCYLDAELRHSWHEQNIFQTVFSLTGETYRIHKNRRTLRFLLNKKAYFVKLHQGVGWREIIKNLLYGRLPVISAAQEWQAIQRLEQLNIATMRLVGYGCRGCNPAQLQSFVITEELSDIVSLEDYCRDWLINPPESAVKHALIEKVADVTRTLHAHGLNHRDLYLCHFLLKKNLSNEQISRRDFQLYLIDLHRMQIRKRVPKRWLIKDLAGLYFSSNAIGLSKADLLRFIKNYYQSPLSVVWKKHKKFLLKIILRTDRQLAKEKRMQKNCVVCPKKC